MWAGLSRKLEDNIYTEMNECELESSSSGLLCIASFSAGV
jgi:hypothetical protein